MSRKDAFIAAHRFGLGPKPGEINRIADDPRGWLIEQLDAPNQIPQAMKTLPPASDNVLDWWDAVTVSVAKLVDRIRNEYTDLWFDEARARLATAVTTEQPFRERLVWFWGNHFTVSGRKAVVIGMAGAHEREAVRPHVTGKFRNMLHDAVSHPAMLFYLDNYLSIGPQAQPKSLFYQGRGLNENLAREILELHTLGVAAGYTQQDVREFAKMLTGWTFARRNEVNPGGFGFHADFHEPGDKKLLGKTYPENGEAEARAVLDLVAGHEATARHIAFKLARHFIDDNPPVSAVDALAAKFLESDGDLKEVGKALVALPEVWQPVQRKFKTPREYLVGVLRAVSGDVNYDEVIFVLNSFGQLPLMAPSPAGWPDVEDAWLNADSALRRARYSASVAAQQQANVVPAELAQEIVAGLLPEPAMQAITLADNAEQGLALLLASPAMQRR